MIADNDDRIRAFLADEARRAVAAAGSLDEAVGRLAPRIERRPAGASQRLIVLMAATLLLVAALGSAIAIGSGILRLPLVIDSSTVSPFEGTWVSTSDADGGTQTMSVRVLADGAVDITVRDTIATVCSGASSTMTGTGALEGGTRIVVPAPVYTCDDGSEARAFSGPRLEEQLRNWTLALDPMAGTLNDRTGGVWHREGAAVPPESSFVPTALSPMWPQSSLEEVREAQELADAGDARYSWQVDTRLDGDAEPWGSEIFTRFIGEELGWEQFIGGWAGSGYGSMGPGGGVYQGVVFIRCAPGRTNPLSPLYADAPPEIRACAPTIDESTYETLSVDVSQPARRGPEGIWVVDRWELRQSESSDPHSLWSLLYPEFDGRVAQVVPPSDAEVTALVQAFLAARVDGEGAEQFLLREPGQSPFEHREVPLLYAASSGLPYARTEFEHVQGPVWPTGWSEFKVRLFAEETTVEQVFAVVRQDARLGLVYGFPQTEELATTENGQTVAVAYSILDGAVTFAAAPPWDGTLLDRTFATLGRIEGGSESQFTMFTVVADPQMAVGCEAGPAPADAEALALSIASNVDLEATAPRAVSVAGMDALVMDVMAPGQLEVGDCLPMVIERLWLQQDARMRLYLLDLPDETPARMLAIGITAHHSVFEHVVEAATPVLDSLEVQTP